MSVITNDVSVCGVDGVFLAWREERREMRPLLFSVGSVPAAVVGGDSAGKIRHLFAIRCTAVVGVQHL